MRGLEVAGKAGEAGRLALARSGRSGRRSGSGDVIGFSAGLNSTLGRGLPAEFCVVIPHLGAGGSAVGLGGTRAPRMESSASGGACEPRREGPAVAL